MFYISASVSYFEMAVRDLTASSLTTVSSDSASYSKRGRKIVLSPMRWNTLPISSAIAKSTSSSSLEFPVIRAIK